MTHTLPLLVSLKMDDNAFAHFNALRTKHFPPAKNRFEAHITLFHWLPGDQKSTILADMQTLADQHAPFTLQVMDVWRLKNGVAYRLESDIAQQIYRDLRQRWHEWMEPEEQQRPFIPHITVQNKVEPEEAKALCETLTARFQPSTIHAVGLDMWELRDGMWVFEQTVHF